VAINKKLLTRFLHDYPFQPATAVWRVTEIDHVISYSFPEGIGLDLGCGDGQLTGIMLERQQPIEIQRSLGVRKSNGTYGNIPWI